MHGRGVRIINKRKFDDFERAQFFCGLISCYDNVFKIYNLLGTMLCK